MCRSNCSLSTPPPIHHIFLAVLAFLSHSISVSGVNGSHPFKYLGFFKLKVFWFPLSENSPPENILWMWKTKIFACEALLWQKKHKDIKKAHRRRKNCKFRPFSLQGGGIFWGVLKQYFLIPPCKSPLIPHPVHIPRELLVQLTQVTNFFRVRPKVITR